MPQVNIRKAKGSDLNFIFDTFNKSMKHDSALGRSCKYALFNSSFPKVIDYILHHNETLIACLPGDEDVILGYIIFNEKILYYCFVKEAFRRLGVAKDLFSDAFKHPGYIMHPFKTNGVRAILKDKEFLIYNPFILMKQEI